ncbi:unnamed protein product [Caenorhabditis angaria]|uniref:Domain of unknown function DX domain-containing protein n=1 Tax=Caenorhabditis angaria TaxID=860376 RepID=A0A9P1IK45_9PELO|nr:unnamed protein product [Caenorhabditis angaria]
MKPTTLLVILIAFPICVHNLELPLCPNTFFPAVVQDKCTNPGSKCKTQFAEGQCAYPKVTESQLQLTEPRCCPDPNSPVDFQTSMKCVETDELPFFGLYCKNGYAFEISNKTAVANEGSYCVWTVIYAYTPVQKCFVIDPPKEEDNTMLIIIIVVVVVVLIAIIGIVATVLIIKKKKKGNGGQKSSAENGENKKKEKASKEKMNKGKKGSDV